MFLGDRFQHVKDCTVGEATQYDDVSSASMFPGDRFQQVKDGTVGTD